MKKVTVIGSGSWGTALAVMLAKNGHEVVIWSRRQDAVDELLNDRKNERYLPGVVIPENLQAKRLWQRQRSSFWLCLPVP